MTTIMNEHDNLPKLSDYEKLRLNNIHRNNRRLSELGLDKGFSSSLPQRSQKKRISQTRNSGFENKERLDPPRRSGRKRQSVSYLIREEDDGSNDRYEKEDNGLDSDYGGGSDINEQDDSDSDNDDIISTPPRQRTKRKRKNSVVTNTKLFEKEIKDSADKERSSNKLSCGIQCEPAKTGRSTCRQCRLPIDKGSPRIGMEAWIVGRQAITWQCPECFLSNVTLSREVTGRSKCKATGERFTVGEIRVGFSSHTATNLCCLSEAVYVLVGVTAWIPEEKRWDATEKMLSEMRKTGCSEGAKVLHSVLINKITSDVKGEEMVTSAMVQDSHVENMGNVITPPPKESSLSTGGDSKSSKKRSGRVQWKFGGHTCYGNLLPGKETEKHCYARTHKGNIKTLAKGKAYWSVIA